MRTKMKATIGDRLPFNRLLIFNVLMKFALSNNQNSLMVIQLQEDVLKRFIALYAFHVAHGNDFTLLDDGDAMTQFFRDLQDVRREEDARPFLALFAHCLLHQISHFRVKPDERLVHYI